MKKSKPSYHFSSSTCFTHKNTRSHKQVLSYSDMFSPPTAIRASNI
nr:MAG TPA: hypothetical protein [Caudoviricetes sp.]